MPNAFPRFKQTAVAFPMSEQMTVTFPMFEKMTVAFPEGLQDLRPPTGLFSLPIRRVANARARVIAWGGPSG